MSEKIKIESADIVGGRCMQGKGRTIYINENNEAKLWKVYVQNIINEENEFDQIADANTAERSIKREMIDEIMEAFNPVRFS